MNEKGKATSKEAALDSSGKSKHFYSGKGMLWIRLF